MLQVSQNIDQKFIDRFHQILEENIEYEHFGVSELALTAGISRSKLNKMSPQINWIYGYVTDDKVYCIYKAKNEEMIREHAQKGDFLVNYITVKAGLIDPATVKKRIFKLYLSDLGSCPV